MKFGIYPGGITGDDKGGLATGPADDPARIIAALRTLQAGGPFLVRGYRAFTDPGRPGTETPQDVERYAGEGRRLDLVVQLRGMPVDQAVAEWLGEYRAAYDEVRERSQPAGGAGVRWGCGRR